MEEWKDIVGFEGLYKVSNMGRVMSFNRPRGIGRRAEGRILKLAHYTNGYLWITLCKDKQHHAFSISRLVAKHFVPNPKGYPEVNHIDEDKENNRADNLEWCDRKYNCNYGHRNDPISSPVVQLTLDGKFVREFCSQQEASRITGIQQSDISRCCTGRRKSSKGYTWRYKE